MRLHQNKRRRSEPDMTSLINIVFLILIFFLVAGAFRPFSARDLKLAKVASDTLETTSPGVLIVHADGRLVFQGRTITLTTLAAAIDGREALSRNKPFTIVADARLSADIILNVMRTVREAGFKSIALMTERERT